MKRIIAVSIIAAAVAMTSTTSFAQCFGGRCFFRPFSARQARAYCTPCAPSSTYCGGYAYAPTTSYWTSGQCSTGYTCSQRTRSVVVATEGATACRPRASTPNVYSDVVDACVPVEETTNPSPCETCGEYTPIKTSTGLAYRSCPSGQCPLSTATTAAVASVSRLLDALNAVRAHYGLRSLTYDSTLTGGSQYQASFCASRGALIHGSGVAEILAQNGQGLETALTQWLNSPAHRALLLSPSFTRGGVAVHRDGAGRVWCAARFQ